MEKINVIGLDLAKNIFQVHGVGEHGQVVIRKTLRRPDVLKFFAKTQPCLVGIESCASAHYWARELKKLNHEVRLMAPAFVKPYVKSNKNDRNDAEAICEAVQRPNMRFVAAKTPEQQMVLHLHHSRRLLVRQRVALSNHMRGILGEYGLVLPTGPSVVPAKLMELLEDAENELPTMIRSTLAQLKEAYDRLNDDALAIERQLAAWHRSSTGSQQLATVPGIGILTATALVATIGEVGNFKNARQLAAFFGLVPKQASTGGKERLLGISKRGDGYVRSLLIHGARAVIHHVRRRLKAGKPGGHHWVEQLLSRCHVNEVAVALANKIARTVWSMLNHGQVYAKP